MSEPRETVEPRRLTLLYQLFLTSQASRRFVSRALADTDLIGETYALYSYLYANGPRTPTEAARDLGYPLTTFASRLTPLVTAGEVLRRAHPLDRRAVLIELSERGRERLMEATPHFAAAYAALLATLEASGLDAGDLYAPLHVLREAIEQTTDRLESEMAARLKTGDRGRPEH